MANYATYLLNVAFSDLPPTPIFLSVASHHLQARFPDIAAISTGLPNSVMRSLAGFGASQLTVAAIASATADGVRIGPEDKLWIDANWTALATNVDLVKRVRALADAVGRTIMSPIAACRRLGLRAK